MLRFHSRLLTPAAIALLASFVGASNFNLHPQSVQDLLGPEIRNMVTDDIIDAFVAALKAEQNHGVSLNLPSKGMDQSDVFLIARYVDGSSFIGSGTIIQSERQDNMVLTAAHVVSGKSDDRGNTIDLESVVAFSRDGSALAHLSPIVIGFNTSDILDTSPASIVSDVAVLRPSTFADQEAEQNWQTIGAPVAQTQYGQVMLALSDRSEPLFNGGASGASLRDEDGAVVGLITHRIASSKMETRKVDLGYLDQIAHSIMMDGDPLSSGPMAQSVRRFLSVLDGDDLIIGGLGVITPILQTEVLDALGVAPVNIVEGGNPFMGTMSAYPSAQVASAGVVISPLNGFAVQPSDVQYTLLFESQMLDVASLSLD